LYELRAASCADMHEQYLFQLVVKDHRSACRDVFFQETTK